MIPDTKVKTITPPGTFKDVPTMSFPITNTETQVVTPPSPTTTEDKGGKPYNTN